MVKMTIEKKDLPPCQLRAAEPVDDEDGDERKHGNGNGRDQVGKFVIVWIQADIQILGIPYHMQEDCNSDQQVHLPREGDLDPPSDEVRDTGQKKASECGDGDAGVAKRKTNYSFQEYQSLHGPGEVYSTGGWHLFG